jgi:serine/threonine protein kinase
MEFAKGGELTSHMNEKQVLSEFEAKKIFRQVHKAVKYIHSKNVIHRDINPNNILFLDEGKENVVLIDFGISGCFSGNVKEKINAGTVRYVPPEVFDYFILDSLWFEHGVNS